MNNLLFEMLAEIEQDENGLPTREVLMSARDLAADADFRMDLNEIERRIEKEEEKQS